MKTEIKKTAIFGGSFDPLHLGHIDIVKNLERVFDRVIVVPSYISPFKTGATDGKIRYKLCKKVFTSQKTEVSRFELNKKGVSYSVDTALHFSKKTDGSLFWVIGSEELTRLSEWHEIDKLKTLVTFYVVPRPSYTPNDELLRSLKKRKIKFKFAKFVGLDISSSAIKIDMAFGKANKYLPSEVYSYAVKNNIFNPYAKYVAGLYRHGLSSSRIAHTYRTALRGAFLAKKYGASVDDAITACILHDIGKSENISDYKDKIELSAFPEPTAHSPIGAYIAKREYGVSDEIAHAIEFHSTACGNMSVLDEVVYLADKTEDGRRYPSLEHKRYLCDIDKNIAMLGALKEISELKETSDCRFFGDALSYYKELCHDREIPTLPSLERRFAELSTVVNFSKELSEIKSKAVTLLLPKERSKAVCPVPDKSVSVLRDTDKGVMILKDENKLESTGNAIKDIALAAADELNLHKGKDIVIIDLDGKTIIADYFVIASASSTTAVKALMGYVEDRLTKQFAIDPNKRDVDKEWIALDYGGVIIHIFTDKMREFYNIERLWSDGGNIEHYGD
ncbi:MAG: nicotinate (nicotinamide) nucleotide adenylyltransferase [Clostridiales bacterium]|nr:nicotinate (nicotinamide) nucleotide adenylyltransferase [Clostridiales bacterium]